MKLPSYIIEVKNMSVVEMIEPSIIIVSVTEMREDGNKKITHWIKYE